MPGLALLSPINEAEELSPYQSPFRYARFPGQRSPIAKTPFHYVRDTTVGSPNSADVSMDDSWIYDCYVSEDVVTSPGGYPHSPANATLSHGRSVSVPTMTAGLSPALSVPVVKVSLPPTINAAPSDASLDTQRTLPGDPPQSASELAYSLPTVTTSVFDLGSPTGYSEYSPLEQEAMTIWEVIDELAVAADQFAGLETLLAGASTAEPSPEMDEDTVFWFLEGLNLLVGDCTEVARDLLKFNKAVEQLLMEQGLIVPEVPRIKHASFSEQDMKEVLASAAEIPKVEVQEALAALEVSHPPTAPNTKRRSRERPPSLKLSTDDAVLIQSIRPRSRFESVGALGRFSDAELASRSEMLKKHRVYAVYEEDTPIEDNWSTKSIVDYDAIEPMAEIKQPSPVKSVARPRPGSGQSAIPRPMSSPVVSTARSAARRPPSLTLTDTTSDSRSSQHSSSSSVSSLFSALPRSSFTSNSSPRSSPRGSLTFDGKTDKPRFQSSSGNFKKMFSNLFKKREGVRASLRPFGKRTAGGGGSVDSSLSALSLSAMSSSSTLTPLALGVEPDPFAASPPPPLRTPPPGPSPHARSASEASPLDGYSSMFNPVKAASRFPPQPLFGEPTP
ncbi:hypothetical protein C8Q79DRAFT_1013805 [Trametes meyenii]|nr:hypothetical protein C8Q79DRAFT_1013805 [Trametes meyenii]